MTPDEAMTELASYENPDGKRVLMRHGARDPFWGVRIGDMKKIVKKIKQDHALALELYATGNSDAMYLAGLIADPNAVTKQELRTWVGQAYWYLLSESTVAALAAESPHGWELGIEWIDGDGEMVRTAGWATLAGVVSFLPDEQIDLEQAGSLLDRVEKTIHESENRVRYAMNSYVICLGAYVASLSARAKQAAGTIGKVRVEMGETECKVPFAPDYIEKSIARGSLDKKRPYIRC